MKMMSGTGSWWTEGIRKGWIGRYETELVYFLQEKYGGLTPEQQLVLTFLSLFLKSGHTTLPLNLTPQEWGRVIGLPPESIELLGASPIEPESLIQNRAGTHQSEEIHYRNQVADSRTQNGNMVSFSLEELTPLVITEDRVSFRKQSQFEAFITDWIAEKDATGAGRLQAAERRDGSQDLTGASSYRDTQSVGEDRESDKQGGGEDLGMGADPNEEQRLGGLNYDPERISEELDRLYPEKSAEINWQKVATALSVTRTFTIISGGPGTGKTTTVANLLALHIRLADTPLHIALAAPTGKAGGRMAEALQYQWSRIGLSDAEKRQIPAEAKTIHRLLSGTERRGLLPPARRKTLPYDLIVVDEASMIDLQLMYRLLYHLGEHATLILLGDRNQLASVEAGSVFSDLCTKNGNGFGQQTAEILRRMGIAHDLPVIRSAGLKSDSEESLDVTDDSNTPPDSDMADPSDDPANIHDSVDGSGSAVDPALHEETAGRTDSGMEDPSDDPANIHDSVDRSGSAVDPVLHEDTAGRHGSGSAADSIVYLTKSYRYHEQSGIGQLSETILSGRTDGAEELFSRYDDLHHDPFRYDKADLKQLADEIYREYAGAAAIHEAEELLQYWKRTMRLTVLRHGPPGSQRLNSFAEQQIMLKRPGLVRNGWYHGRPFIVTQNDYSLGIFNGDTGVAVLSGDGKLEAHVESGSGIKVYSPGQLTHIEPAYFLTVHKSQGSEFDHVQLFLPQNDTKILSRELIYTAVSRARKSFHLKGDLDLFKQGSKRKTERYTGF